MPKESKKFINPLLRPSQEAEARSEAAARVPRNPVVDTLDAPHMPVEAQASSTVVEETLVPAQPSHEVSLALVPERILASPQVAGLAESSRNEHDERQEKLAEEERAYTPVIANVPENISVPEEQSTEPALEDLPSELPLLSSLKEREIPATNFSVRTTNKDLELSPTNTITYTPTETSTETSVRGTSTRKSSPSVGRHNEKKDRRSFTATETVRRKRGALAFEMTHERITLWIDKELKQAFEVLASERELPKTALLNEAVADLLKKYGL